MRIHLADDDRQRAADVVALALLARLTLRGIEPDLSRLGALVAAAAAAISPEELRGYTTRSWEQAARDIKIAFVKNYLANRDVRMEYPANRATRRAARAGRAGPDPLQLPPPAVDTEIGNAIIAALYQFVSLRQINPDWYAPYREQMPGFGGKYQ